MTPVLGKIIASGTMYVRPVFGKGTHMGMTYSSTRGMEKGVTASQAILKGIASDGGLFVPDRLPRLFAGGGADGAAGTVTLPDAPAVAGAAPGGGAPEGPGAADGGGGALIPLGALAGMDYREVAFAVMRPFLADYTDEELKGCIDKAYDDKFDTPAIAPLRKVRFPAGGSGSAGDGQGAAESPGPGALGQARRPDWPGGVGAPSYDAFFLELFHGATIAFKDMALSILPHLLTVAAQKNHVGEKIVILTATSGDTGKAAMAGFADVPGTEIIVFYPKGGVSRVQELQMTTQKGSNTHVVAIEGNFDDAQTGVKKIFADKGMGALLLEKGCRLSSANSINIGRLVPQVAYYVYAYGQLLRGGEIEPGDGINVVVPTGNFGNILAAYFAKGMGLPIKTLICASNDNKVLFDFFQSGVYDKNREFILTDSPSMDILVSSNLERLLYLSAGRDAKLCADLMAGLSGCGEYHVTPGMRAHMADFWGGFANQDEAGAAIGRVFGDNGYVIDTHTGVAAAVYGKYLAQTHDATKTVIAATASPYKFSVSVVKAIRGTQQSACPAGTDRSSGGAWGKTGGSSPGAGTPVAGGGVASGDEFASIEALHALSGVPIPQAIEEIKTAPVLHHKVCSVEEMADAVKEALGL
jgi:threonine synthase